MYRYHPYISGQNERRKIRDKLEYERHFTYSVNNQQRYEEEKKQIRVEKQREIDHLNKVMEQKEEQVELLHDILSAKNEQIRLLEEQIRLLTSPIVIQKRERIWRRERGEELNRLAEERSEQREKKRYEANKKQISKDESVSDSEDGEI